MVVHEFTCVITRVPRRSLITLSGELDGDTTHRLRDSLRPVVSEGGEVVTLDMAGITFIDSTALGMMLGALKQARTNGGDVRLRAVPVQVRKLLETTGFTRMFTLDP